jgi:phosphohistidine phosphatase
MDLLVWRHGDAMSGKLNPKRPLTERGRHQACRVATWLRAHLPQELRILASPAMRAQQTAAALGLPFETTELVGPDAGVSDVIAASNWPDDNGAVLIVGHQPTLGRLAALLLSGREADWAFKRGSLWWFGNRVRKNETQTVLRTVVASDLIADHYLSLEQVDYFSVAGPTATRFGEPRVHAAS